MVIRESKMSDTKLKCPFCQQGIQKVGLGGCWFWGCPTCCCLGNEKLWQELITKRKALDVAVDALKDMNEIIKNYEYGNGLYYALDGHDTMLVAEDVEKALEQINEIKGVSDES